MSTFVQNEKSDSVKSYYIPLETLREARKQEKQARKQEKEAQKQKKEDQKQEKEAQNNELLEDQKNKLRQEKAKTDADPFLEPHHTHFLLVDNGTNGQFHTEIQLRANLEAHIVASSVLLI